MTAQERVGKALAVVMEDGACEGESHVRWLVDQVVRCLTGCPEVEQQATDYRGRPYTFTALGESEEYRAWVAAYCDGEEGPDTHEWDTGRAP